MSFSILRAESRLSRMVTWLAGTCSRLTDFLPGGITRTKLETIAVEMEAQDLQFYQGAKKGIATGVYRAFRHEKLAAIAATGEVTFSRAVAGASPVPIPVGTQVATVASEDTLERVYATTAYDTIEAGQTSKAIPVKCTVAGAFGNTGASTVTVLKTSVSGVDSCTNAASFANGIDEESEEARRARFVEFVQTLPRATGSGIIRGAKSAALYDATGTVTEKVVDAFLTEPELAPYGQTYLYVWNGTGTTSTELATECQKIINGYTDTDGNKVEGYKAAGVVCTVLKAIENAVAVTCTVTVASGYDATTTKDAVEAAISAYLSSLKIGQTLVYHELVERIMGVPGVSDVTMTTPTANVVAQNRSDETFDGAGLDDVESGGTYSGDMRTDYLVRIDAEGTPDTFRWSKNAGVTWEATGVAITGSAQALDDGATVTFGATTGHTADDEWTFTGTRGVVHKPGTITVN